MRGARLGERRGGRAKGTPNKRTVARAAIAACSTAEGGHRLAGDVVGFARYARQAIEIAAKLAPFQSPTFRAVMVAPPDKGPEDDVQVINLRIFDHTGTAVDMVTRSAQED